MMLLSLTSITAVDTPPPSPSLRTPASILQAALKKMSAQRGKNVEKNEAKDSVLDKLEDKIGNTIDKIVDTLLTDDKKDGKSDDKKDDASLLDFDKSLQDMLRNIKDGYEEMMNDFGHAFTGLFKEEKESDDKAVDADDKTSHEAFKSATELTNNASITLDRSLVYHCKQQTDDETMVVIEIDKSTKMAVEVFKNEQIKPSETKKFDVDTTKFANFIVITSKFCEKGTSYHFYSRDANKETKLRMFTTDHLQVEFNKTINIISYFADRTKIQVQNNLKLFQSDPSNRLQFLIQTSMTNADIRAKQRVSMLINKNGTFPTTSNYQMRASGNMGDGLVKTFSQKTNDACKSKDCNYQVGVYTSNVPHFVFFPVLFANDSVISFNKTLSITEEVENGEVVTYKLMTDLVDSYLVFELIPTQADVVLRINADSKPARVEDYSFIVADAGVKKIVISSKDLQNAGNKEKRPFFVTFESKSPGHTSTFKLSVRKYSDDSVAPIEENNTIFGHIGRKQLKQYSIDLLSDKDEKYSMDFNLQTNAQNLNFIVKECISQDINKCAIYPLDVSFVNTKKVDPYKDRMFKSVQVRDTKPGSHTSSILLDFECSGKNNSAAKKEDPTKHISEKCSFVIGIDTSASSSDTPAEFKLKVKGTNRINSLFARKAKMITVNTGETQNFVVTVDKDDLQNYKFLNLKIISLSGSFKVFISKTNQNPNLNDFDTFIDIKEDSSTTISSGVYRALINLEHMSAHNEIYMSVVSTEYCVLQIYTDYTNKDSSFMSQAHHLNENQVVHEKLTTADSKFIDGSTLYFRDFLYKIPPFVEIPDFIQITVNSNQLGLVICVQDEVTEYDPTKECDYYSENETLTIANMFNTIKIDRQLLISVQKRPTKDKENIKLPVSFSVLVTFSLQASKDLHILSPGQSHASLLKQGKTMKYQLSTNHIKNKGLIILSTDHPSIKAYIYAAEQTETTPIATLDSHSFAMRINNIGNFKNKYTSNEDADLLVKIVNSSDHDYRFVLTFATDTHPIVLKEGSHFYIPADVNQQFVYEADADKPIYFNAFSEKTSGIAYAKVLSESELRSSELSKLLDGTHFDFKTDIVNDMQITIHPSSLAKQEKPFVGFLYSPKMNMQVLKDDVAIYNSSNRAKVGLHSQIMQLKGYEQTGGSVTKGEFMHYYFTIDEPQEFSVILTVETGEAAVFLNPGMFNYTTLNHYWKKRATYKGEEIIITKDMFKKESDIVGAYTVGVYGQKSSTYSLMYLPEFTNFIRIKYQHLVNIKLKPDTYYFFDFYNQHDTFATYLYASDASVGLSLLNYDEKQGEELIEAIQNEENFSYNRTFKKGDPPIFNLSHNESDLKSHYIIRARALGRATEFTLAIYDRNQPLLAWPNKKFFFTQEANVKRTFKILLNQEYDEVDVIVKALQGSVTVKLSDFLKFENEGKKVKEEQQEEMRFKVKQKEGAEDILLFRELYILVESEEFASYSVLVKPKNSFVELKAQESELIRTSVDTDTYYYFPVEKADVADIQTITLQIKTIHLLDNKPELLFMPNVDVSLSEQSSFIPMPLVDYIENTKHDFTEYDISPEVVAGVYVIKFAKTHSPTLVKISLVLNDQRNLELNGYAHASALGSTVNHSYSLFVPQAGDVRLILDTCSLANITNVRFNNAIDYSMQDNFYQSNNIVVAATVNGKLAKSIAQVKQPLKRIVVNQKGVLTFEVAIDDKAAIDLPQNMKDYYILSEFKSKQDTLVLKDYLDVFSDPRDVSALNLRYFYNNSRNVLMITTEIPRIKDQLYQDYPKFKKIVFKIHYFLHSDNKFLEKFEACGIDAIRHVKHVADSVTKTVQLPITADFDPKVELPVFKRAMKQFQNDEVFYLFSYISVYFYENQEEEFGITLNTKFALVPYLFMSVPNMFQGVNSYFLTIFMSTLIVAVFVLITLCIYCGRMGKGETSRYRPAHNISRIDDDSNRLEMSTISNL